MFLKEKFAKNRMLVSNKVTFETIVIFLFLSLLIERKQKIPRVIYEMIKNERKIFFN